MRIQRSTEISTSPEKVWPFMIEPEKVLKWCITFEEFRYPEEQQSGTGTHLYVKEKKPGQPMKLNFVTTDWVENEKIAFRMESGDFVKKYEQVWAIEAMPSGSRLTFSEDIEFPYGVLGKVLGIMSKRGSEAHVKTMLANLKMLAEAYTTG
jgi:uncharacterized protein YndB with AHSA1/START domain